MTEQTPSAIGTVAQEAARLIEDMATLARSSSRSDEPSRYAGGPVPDPASSDAPPEARSREDPASSDAPPEARSREDPETADEPSDGACSGCGCESDHTSQTPVTCKLCPLCRGIALFRSVRPETVDLLADLALAMATSLREVATRSRASDPASPGAPASGGPPERDRATVQDIPVDDESEG